MPVGADSTAVKIRGVPHFIAPEGAPTEAVCSMQYVGWVEGRNPTHLIQHAKSS